MIQSRPGNLGIVLLSGGIDSSTVLAIARQELKQCIALTFRYGQKHIAEIEAAKKVAEFLGAEEHIIIDLPLGENVVSALTDDSIGVPKGGNNRKEENSIPVTYVPARNVIFLSFALAIAETAQADSIYIGVSSVDYSGYPDCRPEFIRAFENMAAVATKRAVEGDKICIKAPLQNFNKAQTILKGVSLGVDYSLTLSCYDPDEQGRACGQCDSCRFRMQGFIDANVPDPTLYQ